MDLTQIPLFKALTRRLGFLDDRQRVLSENIANVDTPEFKPKDLKTKEFERMVLGTFNRLKPVSTNPQHITQPPPGDSQLRSEKDKDSYETEVSGNSVSLEKELLKVAQTTFDHQTISNLYTKQLGMIKTALDRGGN